MLEDSGTIGGAELAVHEIADGAFRVPLAVDGSIDLIGETLLTARRGLRISSDTAIEAAIQPTIRRGISVAGSVAIDGQVRLTRRRPISVAGSIAIDGAIFVTRRATLRVSAIMDIGGRIRVRWRVFGPSVFGRRFLLTDNARRMAVPADNRRIAAAAERKGIVPRRTP